MKCFVGDCSNFEGNLTNRKPMEFFESRCYMMVTSNRRDDDTSQSILNFLKFIKRDCRKVVVKGIAVIKF